MSNSSVPLLSAHSITKSFGPRTARHQVLFDVSADVHAGECLAVIGGSGSGKSTLTRIMLGLESADSGSVEYESQSIVGGRKSPGFATLRRESGLVFQDPFSSLDPRWQVAKSVAEPLSLQRRDLNNTDIDERVVEALTMAGLEPVPNRPVWWPGAARGHRPRHHQRAQGNPRRRTNERHRRGRAHPDPRRLRRYP